MCDSRQPTDGAGAPEPRRTVLVGGLGAAVYVDALRSAVATACRCTPPPEPGMTHFDYCPVNQYGFTAARELIAAHDTQE